MEGIGKVCGGHREGMCMAGDRIHETGYVRQDTGDMIRETR